MILLERLQYLRDAQYYECRWSIKWNRVATAINLRQSGKVTGTNKYLNGSTTPETINTNTYDRLEDLQLKLLAISPWRRWPTSPSRGWLKGINRDYVSGTVTNKWFGFDLGYDFIIIKIRSMEILRA
jgi:hypothetical protein